MKSFGQSRLVTRVFGNLIADRRLFGLLESIRRHFADANVWVNKQVGQGAVKQLDAVSPLVHFRLFLRHFIGNLGSGFQDGVGRQCKEGVRSGLSNGSVRIFLQIEQRRGGGFGGLSKPAKRFGGGGADSGSWIAQSVGQRGDDRWVGRFEASNVP
jgi:hypothetical protein